VSTLTNRLPEFAREREDTVPITLVIPTFNEAANVGALLAALDQALAGHPGCEVLFVDDSTDDTPDLIERGAAGLPFPVRLIHRDRPTGGLGGAVCEGLGASRTRWAVVMDADLQHPPRLAPALAAEGERNGAGLVVGSRYTGGRFRQADAPPEPAGPRDHRDSGFAHPIRALVSHAATAWSGCCSPGPWPVSAIR
jgi:glycosyltransferase involved in cell wall biosynthesis